MGPDPAASVVRPAAGEPALHRASLRAPFKGGGKLERCWSRPGASAHGPASTTQRKQAGPLAWPRAGGQGMLSVQRHKTRRRAPSQRHISTSLSVQSPGVRLLWVPPRHVRATRADHWPARYDFDSFNQQVDPASLPAGWRASPCNWTRVVTVAYAFGNFAGFPRGEGLAISPTFSSPFPRGGSDPCSSSSRPTWFRASRDLANLDTSSVDRTRTQNEWNTGSARTAAAGRQAAGMGWGSLSLSAGNASHRVRHSASRWREGGEGQGELGS